MTERWAKAAESALNNLSKAERVFPAEQMLSMLDDMALHGEVTQDYLVKKYGSINFVATTLSNVTTAGHGSVPKPGGWYHTVLQPYRYKIEPLFAVAWRKRRNITVGKTTPSDLFDALSKAAGDHGVALRWFHEYRNKHVSWSAIQSFSETTSRLINRAKGIYKPHYTEYALSIRQTLNSPYADKEIIRRPNGSWVYPYFQENANPADRDMAVTNRGLMKCMHDSIPIGVLLQTRPKPAVEYVVLGLALVTEWKNGYFIVEGFSDEGDLTASAVRVDAAHDLARAEASSVVNGSFDANSIRDQRERAIAEVIRRKGQGQFRARLLEAYDRQCAITGCDAVEALEAAHIMPYKGTQTDHPQNGILLRADIHSLFDLGLLAIDPATMTVVMAPGLTKTSYAEFDGRLISQPANPSFLPSTDALARHREWTGL